MTLNITEPTVGASSGSWGQQLNDALTAIVAYVNNVEANAQPVDSDLTAIAALATTAYGRSLLTQANAAAAQSTLGLGSAATQASSAFDPAGAASTAQAAAISAAATDATTKANAAAAASQPLDSDLTAIAALTTTTFGRSFLALADAAAARTLLGLGSAATLNVGTTVGTVAAGNDARFSAGGASLPSTIVSKTTAYTAAAGDFVEADTTTAGFTVTLPTAPAAGALVAVKKVSSDVNTLTIAAAGGGTIDGSATTTTITQWAGLILEHKGSNVWRVAASMSTTGPAGQSATIAVGTVTTGAAGSSATVANSGTTSAAVLDFAIPRGATGATGATGPAGPASASLFADGSDSAGVLDGTNTYAWVTKSGSNYFLQRDVYLTSLTVASGVVLFAGGWRIFINGTLTNNGTIQCNGSDATGSALGSAGSGATFTKGGSNGAAGGTGVGAAGTALTDALGGAGATGGAGSNAAGAGGTLTAPASPKGTMRNLPNAITGAYQAWQGAYVNGVFGAGTGGGAGGGDGTNAGGGGGGGGGGLGLYAALIAGTGAIRARGGKGGNAAGGNAGGGGGGGGGVVVVISSSVSGGAVAGQTIDANSGTGGTGAGTGAAGSAGANGVTVLLPA